MLYVKLQGDVHFGTLSCQLEAHDIQQWFYLGEDSTWRLQAEAGILSDIPRVSIADLLEEMAWKLRQPYIDWIGELSQVNHSLEWWASELAAKNPYTPLFIRVCLLAVARALTTVGFDRPTLVVCSSSALLNEISRSASGAGIAVQNLSTLTLRSDWRTLGLVGDRYLRRIYRRLRLFAGRLPGDHLAHRRRVLTDRGVTIGADFAGEDAVLLFTWMDHRSFTSNGQFKDALLGSLPEMLQERGYRVAYVPLVLDTVSFDTVVDCLLQTDKCLFFPDLFISDHQWRVCRQRARWFNPTIPRESTVCDIPVYQLAKEHVEHYRYHAAKTLTYESLIANLSTNGVRPRQIIHPYEGHSWEQVMAWSVRRHMPHTKVVGYDTGVFSRLVLSMYPAQHEYDLRPLPDRIVTNGPLSRETLLAEGLPPEVVVSGCGLRHAYIWQEMSRSVDVAFRADTRPIRILVATGIGFAESVELAAKAVQAFGGDSDYYVQIKCHPLVDVDQVTRHLGQLSQCRNIQFVTTAISELLCSAHILLYTYTSVCFEAMQRGVVPIFVRAENFLNLDKLEAAPDARWVATTPEDLRQAASEIMQMSTEERRVWQNRASQVVCAALAPPGPECVNAFDCVS